MQGFAHAVILATGWKRSGLAFLAGLLSALAMPPLFIVPGLIAGLMLSVWLLDGTEAGRSRLSPRSWWSAFRIGWWFGFGYFLAGLWWLGAAFLVERDDFLWALPLGVIGLPAGLAFFSAIGFMISRMLWSNGARRILALALGLGLSEFLRGHVLTGFPWNSPGQVFSASLPSLQSASIFGLEALTLIAIAIGASFAMLGTGRTRLGRWTAPVLALIVTGGLLAHGMMRLGSSGGMRIALDASNSVPDVKLRIMQPNISQREKNRPDAAGSILKKYLELSDSATSPDVTGLSDVTHLIWPESPFPFVLADEPEALSLIGEALPAKTMLITGAVRLDQSGADGKQKFYNSLQVIGPDGVITESYDKLHLVPFGEYLPFSDLLSHMNLRQFITTPGGFTEGTLHKTIATAGSLPAFIPLICYEAIFPQMVQNQAQKPQLLMNLTNDAWFGETFGPYQHLEQARMRSVETGLPLVRAANTGISAVIDPFGRVVAELKLGQSGLVDSRLPRAISPPLATYWYPMPLLLVALVMFIGCIFRPRVV
jgi:apolipoprotein N-acyltransferase